MRGWKDSRGRGLCRVVALGLVLLIMAGCQPAKPQIRVEDAWVRAIVDQGAGYMVIYNDGRAADVLIGASSEEAGSVSLHKTVMQGDVMSMEAVPRLKIPPGGKVELKPMGLHLMMMELQEGLEPGQKIRIKLQFEKSGELEVEAEVRKL